MASSSSPCNYDLFLNLRGEDTRDNSISHLFVVLCGKKIKTFLNENINRGDKISPALWDAIQGSKISVVIFSKDYSSSRWCVDELVQILECKNINGQIIIPDFYHVTASDVWHQTGIFGDSFVKLEELFKEKPEMVHK